MLKLRLKKAQKSKTMNHFCETNMNPDLLIFRPICIPLYYITLLLKSPITTRSHFILICSCIKVQWFQQILLITAIVLEPLTLQPTVHQAQGMLEALLKNVSCHPTVVTSLNLLPMFPYNSPPFTYNKLLLFTSLFAPKSYTVHKTEDTVLYTALRFLFIFLTVFQELLLFQ